MAELIRVFILSDNRLFREALSRVFVKKSDIDLVGSRPLGAGAATDVLTSMPDVLLLDSAEFFSSRPDCFSSGTAGKTSMRVLMVAMEEDESLFIEVVRRGACGFIPKEASALDVVNAVRSVAQGEAICPPRLCKRLFDLVARLPLAEPSRPLRITFGLTRREEQLVPLIEVGLTNKEIAQRLNLSEKTVKNHVHRILQKLGASSRLSVTAACHPVGAEQRVS